MEPLAGIAVEIPKNVQRGEAARLFPVLSETSREGRAASVFLSSLTVVDTLADALLRRLGRPIGARTKINCFTEVVLKSDPQFRPEGLIVIDTGRETWSALVECKIGRAIIDAEQLEHYVRKARENEIDCVITISNELVPDPRRPPTPLDGRLTKTVGHFHYSWLAIRSEAEIAYTQSLVTDPEKNFILAELIRFLSHPSAGVEGFDQMPAVWPEVISEIGAGRAPKKSDPRLSEIADAWLQQEKELSLIVSRLVSRRCSSRSERKLRRGSYDPHGEILGELATEQSLVTDFMIPDAASTIDVRADLKSKSSRVSMRLDAPEDRKRPEARLNWLLGQLKTADAKGIEIVAYWPNRAKSTYGTLEALREDPKKIIEDNAGLTPSAFEIAQSCHTAGSFAGRKRFILELQTSVQDFYSNVGRLLSAWAPKPPPPEDKTAAARIEEGSVIDPARLTEMEESLARVVQSFDASPIGGAVPDQDAIPTAPVDLSGLAPTGKTKP
jgi:hypothetical protein